VHSLRTRLSVTLVALVAVTAALLGVGAYVFVDQRLHEQVLADAAAQARFDLTVLIPDAGLPADADADAIVASGILGTLHLRGVETIVANGSTELARSSEALAGVFETLPSDLRQRVASGQIGYAWTDVAGVPSLVVGGQLPPSGPGFYFVHDVSSVESALAQLRQALIVGALALVVVALLVARRIARGVLAPVEAAGQAAERIEQGDLTARILVTTNDELGVLAARFNRMAAAQADVIGRLEAAEAQNRRFVADVAHELRTPLAALVAEASILRDHLGDLPSDARRAGELLVADVGRLRTLVDDLMELSRFDARAEQLQLEPVDVAALVRSVVASRLPSAVVHVSDDPLVLDTDHRRLERILGNLLDNAREHAPGSPVDVSVAWESGVQAVVGAVVIDVRDRGPGIPPERLGRIFDRFYKADPSRHDGSSGLGLAIAAEHTALLGGTIAARARDGGGLVVEVRLPVT
jgi:signal transduction histidine kinase